MRVKILALSVIAGLFAISTVGAFFGASVVNANPQPKTEEQAPATIETGKGVAPASFADLAESLLPAVVNISSTQKITEHEDFAEIPRFPPGSPFEDFFEHFMQRRGGNTPMIPPASLGSGFIIDAENGYIVTNNHVVKDADEVRVTFHDDTTVQAEVIGRDDKTDLAVLKVEAKKPLTAVAFGDSDPLRVGDWVLAIGNPFGLGGTVTAGIVSARQRDINSGPYDDFIQTDASINRGNSGGPMFDLSGKVIGINTAIFSPSGGSVGIGFAIPSSLAQPVIRQILEYGRTRRGWLGVRIQNVTDEIAQSLGLDNAQGALVASVTSTGPAAVAGLKLGDIILEFNGHSIPNMKALPRFVAETPIDTEAKLTYWRDGKKHETTVKIGELETAEETGMLSAQAPRSTGEGTKIDEFGITVKQLSDMLRTDYAISPDVQGLLIDHVADMSEAAEKGLLPGDIIVELNQQPVSEPAKAKEIVDKAKADGRSPILFLVNRNGEARFVALKIQSTDGDNTQTEKTPE